MPPIIPLLLNLTNITIKKLEDKNFNIYYLIVNNDNQDEACFCFQTRVKEGWDSLVNNWENIKEVESEQIIEILITSEITNSTN